MGTRPRSIRFQLVAATAGVSLLVAMLLLPIASRYVESGFRQFETGYAEQELRRLELTLQESADALGRTAIDYSRWNSTVDYIASPRPQWLDENITPDVFENFHIGVVAIADRRLGLVDARTATGQAPRAEALSLVRRGGTCRAAMRERRPLHRFEMIGAMPHIVVCSPVLGEDSEAAPVVGVMAWSTALDVQGLAKVERLLQFPIAVGPGTPGLDRQTRFEGDGIRARLALRDWDGTTSLAASTRLPRPLGRQRELTQHMTLVLLAVALGTPPLLLLLLLEVYVVRRIGRVSHWVRSVRIGDERGQTRALPPPAGDAGFAELQMLSHDFAELAYRLDASRAMWQDVAGRDVLTGLGSRLRLLDDLAAMLAHDRRQVALLLVDLDGFKAINDMHGHPAGDQLLQEVAQRLEALAPDRASSYRLGGDEFALVYGPDSAPAPDALARDLCRGLRIVRHAEGKALSVTACVGVAEREAGQHLGVSELLAHADLALYQAKRAGRGSHRSFTAAMHADYRATLELEAELRDALHRSQLVAWFQPIVEARSGRVLAVEALARWHQPERGWIAPSSFVAVAENSGQIAALDTAVVGSAVAAFGAMREACPSLRLHINLSAQSLAEPGFVARLQALLRQTGVGADAVTVELTESVISISAHHLGSALSELRACGLQLAVDDFGVGASSLGRLAQVRPAAVKIDGSFVADIDGDGGRICHAIIGLSRKLGMLSVAEHVESRVQHEALLAMGCDALQGYAISPPLPAEQALRWLSGDAAAPQRRLR